MSWASRVDAHIEGDFGRDDDQGCPTCGRDREESGLCAIHEKRYHNGGLTYVDYDERMKLAEKLKDARNLKIYAMVNA
jgi:hypothetical protein